MFDLLDIKLEILLKKEKYKNDMIFSVTLF